MCRLVALVFVMLIVGVAGVDAAAPGGRLSLYPGALVPVASAAPAGAETQRMVTLITAAARRYGQSPAAMIAVARCESGLNPRAVNRRSGAAGLFQFMPRTWRTTPYAGESVFDAAANANAAAWMWSVGRRHEWVC